MPAWAVALLVTLVIEVPLVTALFPGRRRRMAIAATVANVFTNLVLNLVLRRVEALQGWHVLPGEIFAVIAEAAVYAVVSRDVPRSLLASSLANALSYGAGFAPFLQPLLRG